MRILTIVDLPWDARLGAVRILMELARTWEAAGHEVTHYCLGDAFPDKTSCPPRSAWRRLRFPQKAAAFVRKNAARFDVIDAIVGTLAVPKTRLNFNGLLVARSIGSHRLYRDFETMARERWPENNASLAQTARPMTDSPWRARTKIAGRIFYTYLQRQLFRNAEKALQYCDLVNVPNEIELESFGKTKPAMVQPYGLSQKWFLNEAAVSPETRLAQQKISFIGMWSLRKGARDWGEIIRQVRAGVPNARFKFLGTMTGNERVMLDLNVSPCDWIEIVSEYQPDDLPNLLSDATVGAFPTYAEGFGLGLLEQLAAGIPAVAYDAPGPQSILKRSLPELLIPVGNVEQFSAALVQILSADLASYNKLVERSIEVASRYVWSTIARETTRLYETHLARLADH
jgi:glycosyltransferase involved in cell wall biosynthesis